MNEIIYCSSCKNSGRTNRCYITGYDSKCGHDVGLAYGFNNNGKFPNEVITCNSCSGKKNKCFITGYDYKCGHDCGWAYEPGCATCNSCGKQLSGKWKMESNPQNNSYFNTTTGRYLGISDGYFLYGDNPNWVYCYCKTCWIKEIRKILPILNIDNQKNATCNSCGKELSGKWTMENNPQNNSYFSSTTGRYLGISDGYFLYGNNPNWVYSYCHSCWVKEIQNLLPSIGLGNKDSQKTISALQNTINELKNKLEIKENEIIEIKKTNKKLENELNKLKEKENNLASAAINPTNINNNFEFILSQSFIDLKIEKIKNILKQSNIDEISKLDNLITSDIISDKMKEDIKNICQSKIKITLKEIIEKIDLNIINLEKNYEDISNVIKEIKEKLSLKDNIPKDVSNESVLPLQKFIDEIMKKIEKIKNIKEEIYKEF